MAAQDPSNEPALIYGKIVELPAGTVSPPQELAQVLNQLFAGVTGPRGMSLNAYARKIFESQGSVSRWLNGHRTPPARFVQQLMRDFEKETGNVIPDEVRAHIQALHVRAIEADNPFRAKEQEYLYQLHDAQERSEEAEATIRVLRSRVVNLEREVDERQLEIDRMATRAATTVSEYEDRIERLERERDVLADDLTRMRRSVERYEAEQERARAESKQLEDALDRLQRTMELAGGAEPADREEPDAGPIRRPAVWGRPMPGRNKYFTGRTVNLRRLRRHLSSAGGTVVLHGIGGVGKTQLAIEYAWRYQSSYDLVWWISADQPPLIGPAIAGMAPDLELPDARAAGIEETARRVKEALSIGEPYRRWLLIVDNAIDPQSLGDLIPRGPGHVIITSRNARWNGSVSAENIDVFTREDSLAFLRRRWSREAGRDAGRLAEMLDDLPLALEQAAALQNMTGMQIDEYLQLLGEQTGELLHLAKSHDYPHSMTAAFTLSIHQLAETSPHAAKILQCCAFFGPDPIPRAVFRPFWGISDQLGEVLSDPGRLSGSLSTLQRRGLIAVDSAAGTIQVHRLVQALVRDGTPAELRDAYRRDARLLVAGSVPSSPEDAGTWATYRELIPHAEHCGLAEGTTPLERAATCDIARFLYLTGDYRTAHDILQIAGTSSVSSYKILIDVLLALGRHQGAYDLAKGNRGTSPGVSAEDRLCTCTRALGHFHEARRLRLQMREAPIQPADLHELAHDHSLVGDHAMARELFQRAYMERSAGPGFSPVDVLESWNGLAREARLCGSYREAIDLGEEAYGYGIRELTVEHHQTLLTAKDLAIAYRRNGELDAALELGRHTEDRLRRLLGSDHPDTLAATMCVSNTLRADAVRSEPREGRSVDHLAEALMLAEAATGRYASVLGPEHPYTHACRVDLALLHHLLGDPETALAIGTSARVGLIASLDEEHEYVLICDLNLRSDLAALGRNEEAARVGTTVRDRLAERPVWYPHLALAYALGEEVGDEERAEITETLRAKHPEVLTAHEGVRIDCDLDPPPL